MRGMGPFMVLVLIVVAAAIFLGACCLGTFFAPIFWMKIVCFIITNMCVVGITVIACAVAMTVKDSKEKQEQDE